MTDHNGVGVRMDAFVKVHDDNQCPPLETALAVVQNMREKIADVAEEETRRLNSPITQATVTIGPELLQLFEDGLQNGVDRVALAELGEQGWKGHVISGQATGVFLIAALVAIALVPLFSPTFPVGLIASAAVGATGVATVVGYLRLRRLVRRTTLALRPR